MHQDLIDTSSIHPWPEVPSVAAFKSERQQIRKRQHSYRIQSLGLCSAVDLKERTHQVYVARVMGSWKDYFNPLQKYGKAPKT